MALQNIGDSNIDDAFYRYKMPKMVTRMEGRGNGIKTNIVNMMILLKHWVGLPFIQQNILGVSWENSLKKTGVSLVNGVHDTAKPAGLLENFIKKYVQCYGCGNPERNHHQQDTDDNPEMCSLWIYGSDVEMRDKLTTFILKNPPDQKKGAKDKKGMRRAEKREVERRGSC